MTLGDVVIEQTWSVELIADRESVDAVGVEVAVFASRGNTLMPRWAISLWIRC